MDQKKSVDELKKIVQDFCEVRDWTQYHNPKDLAIGISTEANELLDLFRFKTEKQVAEMLENDNSRKKIENELADTFYFILRFSQLYDFDLSSILSNKIRINKMKYPVEKARGSNKKYNEYNIKK